MSNDAVVMPDLPAGWAWTSFGDVLEEVKKVNPKEKPENGFVYVDIESIDNRLMRITNPKHYKGADAPSRARQLIKSNDILFSTVRTYLKNIAMVSDDYDGQIASTGFCVIRPIDPISKKLAFYLVQTDEFVNSLSTTQRGTSYPAVRNSDIYEQVIPLPPPNEQHRMVAKIEEMFTNLDAGVEALKKVQAQIKRYRQAVLKYAFEGKLTAEWREVHKDNLEPASVLLERIREERKKKLGGKYKELPALDTSDLPELPDGWAWGRFADIGAYQKNAIVDGPFGSNLKTSDYIDDASGVPVLTIRNIDIGYEEDQVRYISHDKYEQLKRSEVKGGDILVAKIGASYGKSGIYPEYCSTAIIPANLLKITVNPLLPLNYVALFLKTRFLKQCLDSIVKSTAQPAFNVSKFRELPIPIAPLDEQTTIVDEIERRLSIADEVEMVIERSMRQSERLRQSILKRAFEGKLVPQDPNDEHADELLERIKEERAYQVAESKKSKSKKRS